MMMLILVIAAVMENVVAMIVVNITPIFNIIITILEISISIIPMMTIRNRVMLRTMRTTTTSISCHI